jgi:glycosyltransferase involved in cell wall biosynthesis
MLEGVGLRGKILEAWAMARPVVGTSLALSGMETAKNRAAFVADDAESFGARVSDLLESETLASKMGICGRELVLESFSWDAFANLYDRVYRDAIHAGITYPTIRRTGRAGI